MQWGEPAKPHNEPLNLSGAVLAHYEDDDDDDDDGVDGGDDDSEGNDGDEDDDDGDDNEPVWSSSGCCHLFHRHLHSYS